MGQHTEHVRNRTAESDYHAEYLQSLFLAAETLQGEPVFRADTPNAPFYRYRTRGLSSTDTDQTHHVHRKDQQIQAPNA